MREGGTEVNEPTPVREGDALDWLHEQGRQRARSVPEFDLEATLRAVRAARNGDEYALITSQVLDAVQTAHGNAEARADVDDDAQLLGELARNADDDAARRLYRKHRMEVFRFGVHVLADQGLAEEMVQETFIKAFRRAGDYDANRGPVRAWLFTIARSAALDIARRPSSRPLLLVDDFEPLVDDFELSSQSDDTDQALTTLIVNQALDKLPSIYRDVMLLVRDGFTHSEIAERLGIPIGTVKSRILKASGELRAELKSSWAELERL
jgi:RNA polymerase sigma-70 factor (ECF subfamily)